MSIAYLNHGLTRIDISSSLFTLPVFNGANFQYKETFYDNEEIST